MSKLILFFEIGMIIYEFTLILSPLFVSAIVLKAILKFVLIETLRFI